MAKRKEIDIKRAEELASRGLTQEQIACSLGISRRTLFNRQNESDELADAIKRGSAKGIEQVANALFESALAGNTTAMIFFLKSRAGWSEKQTFEIEKSEHAKQAEEIKALTNEQLFELLRLNEEERGRMDNTA